MNHSSSYDPYFAERQRLITELRALLQPILLRSDTGMVLYGYSKWTRVTLTRDTYRFFGKELQSYYDAGIDLLSLLVDRIKNDVVVIDSPCSDLTYMARLLKQTAEPAEGEDQSV